ncbi:MAG: substrate-binding domain-containing protein [Clostridia bacterium]|nr:substrate-binding domain-containing protein [Clostridia bacterium]
MKKFIKIMVIVLALVISASAFAACAEEKNILVISREDGSGTRDAFDGLVKSSDGATLKKDAAGNSYSESPFVETALFLSKTGDVITKVSQTKTAIGYISLGSLNDTVKALTVEGVEATAANVTNGSYKLWRPFVIVTSKSVSLTAAAADFILYLQSTQAQTIVAENKYVNDTATASYTAPVQAITGVIVVRGSTSVDPLMAELIADYLSIGGAKVSGIDFQVDAQGSSHGIAAAKEDTTGNVIGMSSSAIKSADAEVLNQFDIAKDAVAIVVNNANSISNITLQQLFDIYTGEITKFSQLG